MSTSAAALQPEPWPASSLLRRTVAVVDMVGYSDIARILEENIGPAAVTELNRQIQEFMQRSLAKLPKQGAYCVIAKTGDGIILMFDSADDAHAFGTNVHLIAGEHNTGRTEATAQRWFRVGVATGVVSATVCDSHPSEYAGTTIANAVRLEGAAKAGQVLADSATYNAFSSEVRALYGPEEWAKGKRTERFRAHPLQVVESPEQGIPATHFSVSRRTMIGLGLPILGMGVLAGAFSRLRFDPWFAQPSDPLPSKKFVALLRWPLGEDAAMGSIIDGVITAIASELARAESANPSFYITSHPLASDVKTFAQVRGVLDSLGANLVLAVSARLHEAGSMLSLRLIEPQSQKTLRQTIIPASQQLTIADAATHAAANLLALSEFEPDAIRTMAGTASAAAYAEFQAAEALMFQPNDTGLDDAIEKYKQALEIDPRYAKASAKLACAYCRYYDIHSAASALALADSNSRAAVEWAPNLAEAHLARSWVLDTYGDRSGCQSEIDKALSLDPSNTRIILFQAQFYTRCDRWADAETTFSKLLKLRPNYWLAHNELGYLHLSQGHYSAALNEFRAVTLLMRKNALAFTNVGAVYMALGRTTEATQSLKMSLNLEPTGYAVRTMARLLRYEGKYKEAIGFAMRSTGLNPDSSDNWLELGDCYAGLPSGSVESLEAYKKCLFLETTELQRDSTNGPGWIVLALLQAKLGERAKADASMRRAAQYSADDIDSQIYKARVLEALGRREEARLTIELCLKRGATLFQVKGERDLAVLLGDLRFEVVDKFQVTT